MSTTLQDMMGGVSSCCGAVMYEDWGICADCKEHCESEDIPQAEERTFSPEQERIIADIQKKCADAECEGADHNCNIDPCENCGSYKVEERGVAEVDKEFNEEDYYRYCNNCDCNADTI